MPCGSWSVHLLVSFKVTAFRRFTRSLWSFHVLGLLPLITDRAALALGLECPGARQHWADDRITDHRSLLTAAGETLVVVGRPVRAVSMVLVFKEAGMGVFLQLLWVLRHSVVGVGLLHLPSGPKLTVVWNVDPSSYFSSGIHLGADLDERCALVQVLQ